MVEEAVVAGRNGYLLRSSGSSNKRNRLIDKVIMALSFTVALSHHCQ